MSSYTCKTFCPNFLTFQNFLKIYLKWEHVLLGAQTPPQSFLSILRMSQDVCSSRRPNQIGFYVVVAPPVRQRHPRPPLCISQRKRETCPLDLVATSSDTHITKTRGYIINHHSKVRSYGQERPTLCPKIGLATTPIGRPGPPHTSIGGANGGGHRSTRPR